MIVRMCFLFIVFSYFCIAALPPKNAPISISEWNTCEDFILKKAGSFFSQGIFFIPSGATLPYPIEKDKETGLIYIHLKGMKEAFIGQGSHKEVTLSILYRRKPCLVARCEIDQKGTREAQILEQMRHLRGIVQFFSYIPHTEQSCELFLEYFNCGSFYGIGTGILHVDDSEILPIMKDLLIGLKSLHDHGYIHRDIKRENIFLNREKGRVRAALGDLGLALEINNDPDRRISVPNQNCSPEVLLHPNREIDRRKAETFSLGVIFYIMLFEKSPIWSHLIPQEQLETTLYADKLLRYNRFFFLYQKRLQQDLKGIKGIRQAAAALTFQMLNPDPKLRISLEAALDQVESLLRKNRV